MIQSKVFEVRDHSTLIPVLATLVGPDYGGRPEWLIRKCGYHTQAVLLTALRGGCLCQCSANDWPMNRTMTAAHQHIEACWNLLQDGDLIDVRYISGQADLPCESEYPGEPAPQQACASVSCESPACQPAATVQPGELCPDAPERNKLLELLRLFKPAELHPTGPDGRLSEESPSDLADQFASLIEKHVQAAAEKIAKQVVEQQAATETAKPRGLLPVPKGFFDLDTLELSSVEFRLEIPSICSSVLVLKSADEAYRLLVRLGAHTKIKQTAEQFRKSLNSSWSWRIDSQGRLHSYEIVVDSSPVLRIEIVYHT